MITLKGQYYSGRWPLGTPATMNVAKREVSLTAGRISGRYSIGSLKVSPRIGRADRFIALPNGGQFMCADHVILNSLPAESPSEGFVAWLEVRWGVALAGVAIIVCMVVAGYFYGLPAAAERIAARIPIETEQALGREALAWLDKQEWFGPTNLALNKQKKILRGFDRLRSDLPLKKYYHLEFRNSSFIGPNAFALPGVTIVITDDMVKLARSQEEVLTVLAHEIGHVELRHTLRSVLQNSAVAVLAATVTSDAASLSVAVAGLPAMAAQTKYSREFEAAADDYAFRLLKQKGYSPAAFATLMERLSKNHEKVERMFAYVSTHPVTAERIERARAAAQRDR